MNARWRSETASAAATTAATAADVDTGLCLRPMELADLDRVLAVEVTCYAFAWTRGNFIDSLAAGYAARVLCGAGGELLGYFVAMAGVDEMHLLNITVAPAVQGRGHASLLMEALAGLCRETRAAQIWLEVRRDNPRAQAVYRHLGFAAVGVRKGYYPAPAGRREDAVVMSLKIGPADPEANRALD